MDSLYLPPEVWYNGEMKIDVTQLKYKYAWFDAEAAAQARKSDLACVIDYLLFTKKN